MDWRRYDQILPRHMLHGETEYVLAFAIAVGFPCPGGTLRGSIAASFRQGPGSLSPLDLLSHLGSFAVADQLTSNLLRLVTT